MEKYRKEVDLEIKKAMEANDTKNIVSANLKLIEKYYDQNLLQHRLTFITTLIVSCLGFGAILFGIYLYINNSENKDIAFLTSCSGIVAEIISVLFFFQNKQVISQMKVNHKSLEDGLNIHTTISLAENLPKQEKLIEMKKIIKFLLSRVGEKKDD